MKKIKSIFLGTFILVILLTSMTVSAGSPVVINPFYSDSIVTATAGDYVILRYGWLSTTKGLTNLYVKRVKQDISLVRPNSTRLHVSHEALAQGWGSIEPVPIPTDFVEKCPPVPTGYVAQWEYPIVENLVEGEYTLYFYTTIDPPVRDGCDFDGDGLPDQYAGGTRTVTIEVGP